MVTAGLHFCVTTEFISTSSSLDEASVDVDYLSGEGSCSPPPRIDGYCARSGTCCVAEKDVPSSPLSWSSSAISDVLISPTEAVS